MKFIATADLQIGMSLRWLEDAQPRFAQARIDTIATLAGHARAHDARAVVVAGDLFDRDPVDDDDLVRTMDAIGDLHVPMLVLPGNHDSHHPGCVWESARFHKNRPDNLHLLLDDPVDVDGVTFVGAPLMTRHPDHPTLHRRLATLDADGRRRVLVGHGAITQVVGDHGNAAAFDLTVIEEALADGRTTFVVLGDRHSTLSVGTTGRVWYPGAPEPTDFGDDTGHALLVELADDATVQVDTLDTGTWRFVRLEPEVHDSTDVTTLLDTLTALPRKTSVVVKVRPSGVLPFDDYRTLEAGLADAAPRFASLQTTLERVMVLPDSDDIARLDLPPYAKDVLETLLDEAADPHADAARDELLLLLRTAREVGA